MRQDGIDVAVSRARLKDALTANEDELKYVGHSGARIH